MVKTIFLRIVVLGLALGFLPAGWAAAQEPPQVSNWTGEVRGQLRNQTTGEQVTGEVEVMLHGYDLYQNEKLMEHGKTAPDGTFLFAGLAFEPGLQVTVMATYEGGTYFAEPLAVEENQDQVEIEVPVYASTTDLTDVQVSQAHILFAPDQGRLEVTEVYVISNMGDRTVSNAVTLDSGTQATLKFSLPEGAANVSFGQGSGSRYLQYPGGFADTAPLLPGEASSQVIVSYVLPYRPGMQFELKPFLPLTGLSVLAPATSGLAVEGGGISPAGTWPMQNGESFNLFESQGIFPGETLNLTLTGGSTGSQLSAAVVQEGTRNAWIGVAGAALGAAMLLLGLWWWRRPLAEVAAVEPGGLSDRRLESLLTEIAQLDEASRHGVLSPEVYAEHRRTLVQQAKEALHQEDAVHQEDARV